MIISNTLQRRFQLAKNNTTIALEDINPNLTPEEIKELYSTTHPELINATITNKGIENETILFEFQCIAGTKG